MLMMLPPSGPTSFTASFVVSNRPSTFTLNCLWNNSSVMASSGVPALFTRMLSLPESLLGFGEKPRNVRLFRDVSLYGKGLATIGSNFLYNAVGALLAGRVVHHNGRTLGSECLGDVRTDTFRSASYNCD